ncbi:MAG: SMI1/KNR4 family protein [Taibaiella sp.]|nr:SMI1/KNR4 family protein [Taibaiella sp.]
MNYFEEIKNILFEYNRLGEDVTSSGAILIGKAPHIAPLAWLHSLFPPLNNIDIQTIEKNVGISIPEAYKNFLGMYGNGLRIFSDSFNLYGLRKIEGRSIEAVRQPYDLDIPNTDERPKYAEDEDFFIGGYGWDGSKLYVKKTTEKVYYCARRDATPLFEWSSFEEMLVSEVLRLQKYFDKDGKRIDKRMPTTPIIIK